MRLSLIFVFSFVFGTALANAGKTLSLKVSVNMEIPIQLLVSERDHGQIDPAIGTFQVVGDAKSVVDNDGIRTHAFELLLPKDLTDEDAGKLVVTVIEKRERHDDPLLIGFTLFEDDLSHIADRHIRIDLVAGQLDVGNHFRANERVFVNIESAKGFNKRGLEWVRKPDTGGTVVGWVSACGEAKVRIARMDDLENSAKSGAKLLWKGWSGTVTKDKPTVWKENAD